LDFDHDAAGNITGLTSSATASQRGFGLDALHRVTSMTDAAPTPTLLEGFTYDATGNRTSHTEGAATTAYGYPTDSHRLIDVGGTARSYDNVGNTLQRGPAPHDQFTYGDNNRLLRSGPAVGAPDAHLAMNYLHNGRGERVLKSADNAAPADQRIFLYDEAGRLLGEYDGTGTPLKEYAWFTDRPVTV